jgi:prolyl-tRNA synthetase
MFVPTRKEDPADAEVVSHRLLVRGGYIRQVSRGIYTFLPLGQRVLHKIERIIREEMDRAGAQEILMPGVQPSELWRESGRWEEYGPELLRFEDRKGTSFCLGPTHEEVVTALVRADIRSYKQLPLNLYQIQTKFRDEPRPRFGLMRGREFVMKDAYSFDLDDARADRSYEQMFAAYERIFDRFGFDYSAVEADTGNIGGSLSHEFQVLAETGEDRLVTCEECGYAANVEKAETRLSDEERDPDVELDELERIETPDRRTIEEVADFLEREAAELVKTLIYVVDEQPVTVLRRGDHEANQLKIRDALREHGIGEGGEVELADEETIEEVTGAPVGFAGPVGLEVPIVADRAVRPMANFVAGGNAVDEHVAGINHGRDFEVEAFADLRVAGQGDICARCGGTFEESRGIEVGHVFKLGTKYSEALGARVQDEDGALRPLVMGCYGIGVTRIMAAAVEQSHDDDGIIWPVPIAPFHVQVMPLQMRNDEVVEVGERLYRELEAAGYEVALDDRDESAGIKFNDADLLGVPLRIVIGSRGLGRGVVEIKARGAEEATDVELDEVAAYVGDFVDRELAAADVEGG